MREDLTLRCIDRQALQRGARICRNISHPKSSVERGTQDLDRVVRCLRAFTFRKFGSTKSQNVFRADTGEGQRTAIAHCTFEIPNDLPVSDCGGLPPALLFPGNPFLQPIIDLVIVQRLARRAFEDFADDFLRRLFGQISSPRKLLRTIDPETNVPCLETIFLLRRFLQPLAIRVGVAADPEWRLIAFPN